MNNRTTFSRLGLVTGLFLAFAAIATFTLGAKAQSLGTAASFGVLGASTVTNTGASVVMGDVGVSPGSAITGFPPGVIINGGIHPADGPATQAHADFATAYTYYAGLPSPAANDLTGSDLGGLTLTPGVYHFDVAATSNGALTFDAQNDPNAQFVIKIGTTLITSGASTVVLINGADARNVYFQVGTGATLGGGSSFKGNLMAGTAITAVGGVAVTGRLLALTEAVTLDTNTVHVAPAVRNTNDDGIDSLRRALFLAEDGDTITFEIPTSDPGYNAGVWTIGLTSGELVVDKGVRINGLGANILAVQRDLKAAAFRIFHVTQTGVRIDGMTISNGLAEGIFPASAGGGIYNDHTILEVNGCALNGNSASSDSFGGGGIYNDGSNGSATLTLSQSTLSGNSANAGYGGGISNNGTAGSATLRVVNSTLSGNTASLFGGAAIDSDTSAGKSLPVMLTNSTLTDNSGGAGIVSFGELMLGNTILKAGVAGANIDGASNVTSLGYNLSDDDGSGLLIATGDQIDIDPILGPLKDNGGPTLTHAPLSNSPALDQGQDIGGTGADQRNRLRTVTYDLTKPVPAGGDRSDIGAVEIAVGVQPVSEVSRKTHGAKSGAFDINLPLSGPVAIECRNGGAAMDYQLVVTFASPVLFDSAAVTSGIGSVSSITLGRSRPSGSGSNQVTINLTGVANAQRITVALFGVTDGSFSGDVGLRVGMLLGDTTGDGLVNASDVSASKARSGQIATALNFRSDITANGVINSSDIGLIKAHLGQDLPPTPAAPSARVR